METLCGKFSYDPGCGFPLSTDSLVLADFISLPKNAKVVDLGSGSGLLGLLLCGKQEDCTVVGVELDETAHAAALSNIQRNHLEARLSSRLEDLRSTSLPKGVFSCVCSNPPYFASGADSKTHPLARQEGSCALSDVFSAAARLLKFGGDFYLVQKPQRLVDLCALGRQFGLEPKELRFFRQRPDKAVSLVLMHCKKGGKPEVRLLPDLTLYTPDGSETPDLRRIYHIDV